MNVYIPKGQEEKYKQRERERIDQEFNSMIEQLTPDQRKQLLFDMKIIMLKGKIKKFFGIK